MSYVVVLRHLNGSLSVEEREGSFPGGIKFAYFLQGKDFPDVVEFTVREYQIIDIGKEEKIVFAKEI